MNETAAGEYGTGGRAGAHVDDGGAEFGLIVGENAERGHIGSRDHRLDAQMAALDGQHQVARRPGVGGHDMHVHAKPVGQHAARLADAAHAVERIADRHRMQHHAVAADAMAASRIEHPRDVAIDDGAAGDIHRGLVKLAGQPAAGNGDHDRFKFDAGGAFGALDGHAHRLFGLREVDHRAALHAARLGMADTEYLHAMGAMAQDVLRGPRLQACDQAHDLVGADVEHANGGRAVGRHRSHGLDAAIAQAHALPPRPVLRFFSCSWRAAWASSESRTVTRSASRRSIVGDIAG